MYIRNIPYQNDEIVAIEFSGSGITTGFSAYSGIKNDEREREKRGKKWSEVFV